MTKSKRIFKKRRNVGKPKISAVENQDVASGRPRVHNDDSPRPSTSASKKKICNASLTYREYMSQNINYIVDLQSFADQILSICACVSCGGELSFEISRLYGLATSCVLRCTKCSAEASYTNSPKVENAKLYEMNTRFAYALRTIGKGQTPGKVLCAIMNLPRPPTKWDNYNEVLGKSTKTVCSDVMKEAVEEAVKENDSNRDLSVAVDGTWQKRGHTSNNGVVTITSVDTGCVLDVAVFSKHCLCKDKVKGIHNENCKANFIGRSGAMEVQGAKDIFRRSEALYDVRYKFYLGDGDSSAFSSVAEDKPYGPDFSIAKMECVGHVQKRMGTRLRKLKLVSGKNVLADGKTIGGRNRLTDDRILAVQKYYGLAIRRNPGNLANMKQAVWVEYFHLLSTNAKPQHGLCEKGEDSWCKYQRAVAKNEQYNHNDHLHLPEAIMNKIKPIFQDLANPALLKKCLHGKNQNPNESVNMVIWSRLPKTAFVGFSTMEFGVYDAIINFNKGNISRCMVLQQLGISVSKNTGSVLAELDSLRVRRGERMLSQLQKKARQQRASAKRKLDEAFHEEEGPDNPSYGAGMH